MVSLIIRLIDRALPIGDIDGDGIVDLALVGLLKLSAAQASSQTDSASKEGLQLTVDFLSGKEAFASAIVRNMWWRVSRISTSPRSTMSSCRETNWFVR